MVDVVRFLPATGRERAIDSIARLLADFLPEVALEVTIRRKVKKRSDLQNAALWGCAYKALHEQTGNDPDDLHKFFCGEFFGWVTTTVVDVKTKRPRRTTMRDETGARAPLSVLEFAGFYDFVQRRSAMAGFDVPDPDPQWKEHIEQARLEAAA
jgi:hypothetical protein